MQSRRASFIESWAGVAIGLVVSGLANALILPAYGMPFAWQSFGEIALLFTLISFARSYCVRRLFNYLHTRGILQ